MLLCSQHWGLLEGWASRTKVEHAEAALRRAERLLQKDHLEVIALKLEYRALVQAARPDDPKPGIVYAVRRADGLIKIGTTSAPKARMYSLEREYGPLRLLAAVPGGYTEEALLHRTFADHLAEGREWFHPAPAILAWIEAHADEQVA